MLDTEEALKAYSPFMVNRGVAQAMNTVMFAQEMNKRGVQDKEMHFAFLFNVVKKAKRYAKWSKKEAISDDILLVQEVYQVNQERAVEFLELLSPEQLQQLREYNDKGGQIGRKRT